MYPVWASASHGRAETIRYIPAWEGLEEKAQWLHSRLSINLIDHSLGFQVISQPVARKFARLLAFDKEDYRVALKMPQVK